MDVLYYFCIHCRGQQNSECMIDHNIRHLFSELRQYTIHHTEPFGRAGRRGGKGEARGGERDGRSQGNEEVEEGKKEGGLGEREKEEKTFLCESNSIIFSYLLLSFHIKKSHIYCLIVMTPIYCFIFFLSLFSYSLLPMAIPSAQR